MTNPPDDKPVILYADDDTDDRFLLTDSFQTLAPEYRVVAVPDGQSALDFLRNPTNPAPSLLILDLNMPRMTGKEVVELLRTQGLCPALPVVVFTTSASPTDRQDCARFGVDLVTKPLDMAGYEQALRRLLSYSRQ